jgi:hypothetical protein
MITLKAMKYCCVNHNYGLYIEVTEAVEVCVIEIWTFLYIC